MAVTKRIFSPVSLQERLHIEGYQLTGGSVRGNNSAAGFTVGQALGSIAPNPTQILWIEAITVSSSKDVELWIQKASAPLIANGDASQIAPVRVGPSYGTVVIPMQDFLFEQESISAVLRTAVAQASDSGNPDFVFGIGFLGKRMTNDMNLDACKVIMGIGDSIINGTGPLYGEQFYPFLVRRWLRAGGKSSRLVIKGAGGYATSHMELARQRNLLDVQADIIFYALGTNNATLASFQADFPTHLLWKQEMHPDAKMLVLGPPPRQGAAETVMASIRAYEQTTVAALNDPLVKFCSLGAAFSNADDTFFITNDGTTNTTRVHPNAAGHAAMATVVQSFMTANDFFP